MHTLRFRSASGKLREFVRAYAQRELDVGAQALEMVCPARIEQELEFQFAAPFEVSHPGGFQHWTPQVTLVGAYTRGGCKLTLTQKIETFAVFFQPAGFSQLFGMPLRHVSNMIYDATFIAGAAIRRLWNQMAENSAFEQRVRIIEEFLFERAVTARSTPFSATADFVLASRGVVRIAELARHHGLGLRQFERRFLNEIGVSPKLFARVARFQTALDMKVAYPQRSWLKIAHDAHYHDQMHMIRDFHDLAGDTPSQIFHGIGDLRPSALLPESQDEESGCLVLA